MVHEDQMFEVVHTCTDWWDGPRKGIADFEGHPHLFVSEWDYSKDGIPDTFLLAPVSDETFRLALEDWGIWRRWETAFAQGETGKDTHPALPQDKARHEKLTLLLEQRLVLDETRALRKNAEFRVREDASWNGFGWPPLEVHWMDIDNHSVG